jgi:hypothetical protein
MANLIDKGTLDTSELQLLNHLQQDRSFEYVVTKYDFDRYQTLNWLVRVQRSTKCSDLALFKAVQWSDSMLVLLNSTQYLTRN